MTDALFDISAPQAERPEILELTHSARAMWMNCRKAYHLRHIKQLVPLQTNSNLQFGTLIHECLEKWHGGTSLEDVLAHVDTACADRTTNPDVKQAWHYARAMMRGYAKRYPTEVFTVIHLEKQFSGPIVNPETGAASRSFVLSGKVDGVVSVPEGVVEMSPGNYVMENKTAALIDGDYLDKLWMDFQITIYAHYVEKCLNLPIAGVIYNVLTKTKLKQSAGETFEEFQERYMIACSKNKSGKSSATRQFPETDEEFAKRLDEKYAEPGAFHREVILLDRSRITGLQYNLWDTTKSMLEAKRRNFYEENAPGQCYNFGGFHRKCAYHAICRSSENPIVIETQFRHEAPNSELRCETETEPVF